MRLVRLQEKALSRLGGASFAQARGLNHALELVLGLLLHGRISKYSGDPHV